MRAFSPSRALLAVALLAACASPGGPRFSATGYDAELLGEKQGYPKGSRETYFDPPFMVGTWSRLDEVFEARVVRKPARASTLTRAPVEPSIRYDIDGVERGVDDYLARRPTTGLLIVRGDTILVERYQYGRTDRHRFTSWSMGKTVTAMLLGIAIAEGKIRSVDDPAERYVRELAGTEYGKTSLRDLLQMSSGVRFREDYSGNDDVARLVADTFYLIGPGGPKVVTRFNERERPAGTKFSYASSETHVAGLALRQAVERPLAEYLEEKIWKPIGAEADASWLIDRAGMESAYCCINAVLRDYARLGLLLAHGGNWRGRQVIPADWVKAATTSHDDQPHLWPHRATRFFGYGYQTWLVPGSRGQFVLAGIGGQYIYVDPRTKLVLVHTAVRKLPDAGGARETHLLWEGVVRSLTSEAPVGS